MDVPKGGAEGVIIAQAGRFGGWSLYVKDGRPAYAYNWLGRETYKVHGRGSASPRDLSRSASTSRTTAAAAARAARSRCRSTAGRWPRAASNNTIPNVFSTDEGVTVGSDDETVVTDDYKPRSNRFTGTLGKIVVEVK